MKKPIIVFIVIATLILLAFTAHQLINVAVDENYSPTYMSYSIEESKKTGRFVSQPQIQSPVIESDGLKYHVENAWIEQSTRIEYKWFFIRRTIPTGYRFIVTLKVPFQSAEEKSLLDSMKMLVLNNVKTLAVTSAASKDIWLFFGNISTPLPEFVSLAFRSNR